MGQVYEIPFSALEAALLLKKNIVTYNEVMDLYNKINKLGKDYYVVDDEDYPNLVYIQDLIESDGNILRLRNDLSFNSIVDGYSVRDLFESCAGDELLNFVGYVHVEDKKNINGKVKSLVKNKFLSITKNNKIKVRVLCI